MNMLYGDGIHDDTEAIQELLDKKIALVELAMPEKCYLISKTLKIHSYQELKLPRYCHIKLAPNSNCMMITNADKQEGNEYITISGGVWDYNNLNQKENPLMTHKEYLSKNPMPYGIDENKYEGLPLHFLNVRNLHIKDLTIKDPITFALTIDTVSYFTIENIIFDFNMGNPYPVNMDGIHLNGNCHFGTIKNIKGATYDDLIALNADEGSGGPITNIDIDGVYADRCQSFIRLLTLKYAVENIHIHNIYGTCFMYGIGITKWFKGKTIGYYNSLVFDNIYISRGEAVVHPDYPRAGIDSFAMISIESETVIKTLHISDMYRNEKVLATPTIEIQSDCVIENLVLENCADKSELKFPLVKNDGTVKKLYALNINSSTDVWIGNNAEKEHIF